MITVTKPSWWCFTGIMFTMFTASGFFLMDCGFWLKAYLKTESCNQDYGGLPRFFQWLSTHSGPGPDTQSVCIRLNMEDVELWSKSQTNSRWNLNLSCDPSFLLDCSVSLVESGAVMMCFTNILCVSHRSHTARTAIHRDCEPQRGGKTS